MQPGSICQAAFLLLLLLCVHLDFLPLLPLGLDGVVELLVGVGVVLIDLDDGGVAQIIDGPNFDLLNIQPCSLLQVGH